MHQIVIPAEYNTDTENLAILLCKSLDDYGLIDLIRNILERSDALVNNECNRIAEKRADRSYVEYLTARPKEGLERWLECTVRVSAEDLITGTEITLGLSDKLRALRSVVGAPVEDLILHEGDFKVYIKREIC